MCTRAYTHEYIHLSQSSLNPSGKYVDKIISTAETVGINDDGSVTLQPIGKKKKQKEQHTQVCTLNYIRIIRT